MPTRFARAGLPRTGTNSPVARVQQAQLLFFSRNLCTFTRVFTICFQAVPRVATALGSCATRAEGLAQGLDTIVTAQLDHLASRVVTSSVSVTCAVQGLSTRELCVESWRSRALVPIGWHRIRGTYPQASECMGGRMEVCSLGAALTVPSSRVLVSARITCTTEGCSTKAGDRVNTAFGTFLASRGKPTERERRSAKGLSGSLLRQV